MFIRITTLVENSSGEHLGLTYEHGLSFLIEKDGSSYLFDTGQSDTIIGNAQKLALDLFAVEKIILSHSHYDHSGGLKDLLKKGGPSFRPEIHIHKDFFLPKYSVQNKHSEFLGNDFSAADLEDHGCPLCFFDRKLLQIGDGVWIVGNFDRDHSEEIINDRFCLLKEGTLQPDRFNDEIMMVIDSPRGLVLLVGCSHPGIMNMIDTVKRRIDKKIYALLGGTHLVEAGERQLQAATQFLFDLDCEMIGVSHCTGKAAVETLSHSDSRFFHNRTGSSLIIS